MIYHCQNPSLSYCESDKEYIVSSSFECDRYAIVDGKIDKWETNKIIRNNSFENIKENIYNKKKLVIEEKGIYKLDTYKDDENFFNFIILFYPSVSKILTSANSRTVKDPQKSIPIGILGASACSIITCDLKKN